MSVADLIEAQDKTDEQIAFLERYQKSCPVIDNNCAMNLLCHYLEGVRDNIKINIKNYSNMSYLDSYKSNIQEQVDPDIYNKIHKIIKELRVELKNSASCNNKNDFNSDLNNDFNNIYEIYRNKLFKVCSNQDMLINCLINIFYIDFTSYNKDVLWNLFGNEIFQNVLKNNSKIINYPVLKEDGEILYLGKKYGIEQFEIRGDLND
jgi:hypothetical protein